MPAARAAAALLALKDTMGANYPMPLPQQALQRADLLLQARQYAAARSEYESLLDQLVGVERDQARVRIGAADLAAGKPGVAARYLRGLELPESEADAERLYYLEESARRMNDEAGMSAAVEQLGKRYPKSPWRLKALVGRANRFLVTNRPDDYVPLYKGGLRGLSRRCAGGPLSLEGHVPGVPARPAGCASNCCASISANTPRMRPPERRCISSAATRSSGAIPRRRAPIYERLARAFPNQFYAMQARERLRQPEIAGAAASDDGVAFRRGAEAAAGEARRPPKPTRPTSLRIERSRLLRSAGLTDLADAELRFGARTDGQSPAAGHGDGGAPRSRRTSRCAR